MTRLPDADARALPVCEEPSLRDAGAVFGDLGGIQPAEGWSDGERPQTYHCRCDASVDVIQTVVGARSADVSDVSVDLVMPDCALTIAAYAPSRDISWS